VFVCFDVAPFPAVEAELDFHPGVLFAPSSFLAALGVGLRYAYGFPPGTYDFLDPMSGAVVPGTMDVGYQHFAGNMHATFVLGSDRAPTIEPSLGFGYLSLPVGLNTIGLTTVRYGYGSAGVRGSIAILPGVLGAEAALEGRVASGAGAAAEATYGSAGFGRALGLAAGADVVYTPFAWLRLSLGYALQRLSTRFDGGGSSGLAAPKVTDTIHDVHAGVGIVVP
jgi:hypothetical protein